MKRLVFVLLLCCGIAAAQRIPQINLYNGDPTGVACTVSNGIVQSSTTGSLYSCVSGHYVGASSLNLASPGPIGNTTPNVINGTAGNFTGRVVGNQIGAVYQADQFTGTDFSIKVNACLSAVVAAGGGTCDARALSGSQTASSSITVGDGLHRTTLILPVGSVTFAAGRQLIYRAYSTITGQGYQSNSAVGVSEIICTNPTASCIQSYNEPGGQLLSAVLSNFDIISTGTVGASSVGLQLSGTGYVDVLDSHFSQLAIGRFNTGTLIQSVGGCICYDTFDNLDSAGSSFGVHTQNISGYGFGVNSDQWRGGRISGPVGLYDSGTAKFTYSSIDMESNVSTTGAVLYVNPYNGTGTGYAINDTGTISGGSGTAVYTINAVSGGVPTALSVTTAGTGYTNAVNQATTATTGVGVGLQVDVRVSAYMLLTSNGGTLVVNPYEEAGGGDYICGTGNYVEGAWGSANGSIYAPTYCTGSSNQYGGPASNFVWGTGSTPRSIGVAGYGYLAMASGLMYDPNIASAYVPSTGAQDFLNIFADGPAWNGINSIVHGAYGHATWNVGLTKPHSGTVATGRATYSQLANPSAPTLTAVGGTGTTSAAYGLVCNDGNGGTTLPATPTTTVSGPAALGAWLTLSAVNGGSGYVSGDVGATFTINAGTIGQSYASGGIGVITSVSGGAVTGVSINTAGSGYNTIPFPATGYSTAYATTGGTGTGLTVTGTSTYIRIGYPIEDGCASWTVLKGSISTQLKTPYGQYQGSTNASANVLDFGGPTVAYAPGARNTTGDVSISGQLSASGYVTTRGDLQGYSTAPARIPVGTDGYVLQADSTQALGLKWAVAASGFTAGGDLSGTSSSQTVAGIQSHAVSAPSTAGYLHWNGSAWEYANPSGSASVNGPGSSSSGDIATFNGTSGTTLQDSGINISSGTITATGALHIKAGAGGNQTFLGENGSAYVSLGSGFSFFVLPSGGNMTTTLPIFGVMDQGGYNKSLAGSSGQQSWIGSKPIINQTSSAGATDILDNRTETAVGSGPQLLIDLQVAGTSKFNVDHSGIVRSFLFSAGGTSLPTCNATNQGAQGVVSDATAPTYMGAYTSGGAITAAVICSYNGTTYAWLTH